MKLWKLFVLAGVVALLAGAIVSCASTGGGVTPIGTASGTATGTAPGFSGDIDVTITMVNGYITDVVVEGKHETATIGVPAMARAPDRIKKYNSAQFDVVSGATITCMGVSEAAQKAIDKIVAGN